MTKAGRPRRSSRPMLEDAAQELFLEQGYTRTTIDQITRRAGVARNTYFNYFQAKGDILWVDVDDALAALETQLGSRPEGSATTDDIIAALLALADSPAGTRVPWAVTQRELLGLDGELAASGAPRVLRAAAAIRRALPEDTHADAFTAAVLGAALAGAARWAGGGVRRGPLRDYVAAATEPVARGFAETPKLP